MDPFTMTGRVIMSNRNEVVAAFIATLDAGVQKKLSKVSDDRIMATDAFRAFKREHKPTAGPSRPRLNGRTLAGILLGTDAFTPAGGVRRDELGGIAMAAGFTNRAGDAPPTSTSVHMGEILGLRVPGILGPEALVVSVTAEERPGAGRNPVMYRPTGPEAVAHLKAWASGGELPPCEESGEE
jgi:hypothetical protein